jgi:cytochrome c-type biogenesis protein CcsB
VMGRIAEQGFPMAAPAAGLFAEALSDMLKTRGVFIDPGTTGLEVFYWKLRPFHLAWILYVMSAVVWLLRGRGRKGRKKRTYAAAGCFAAAFLLHTAGFVMRIIISGRPPVTNMYESVIWVSWGTVLFACVLWYFYRSNLIPNAAAVVAALGLMIGENMPAVLDQSLSPLVPVLRDNFWLTTHVLTITLGYGAFALNWGIAHALLYRLAWTPRRARAIKDLTNMLYRSLQIGVILLSSGTVLGGVWANYSWGRFWGWDPKETWALIAILCYLAVLHGRLAGWLSTFGTAFWCAVSFLSVIMAWYGVNFVLGAGLHSYGFGGGGLQYVSVIVAIDLAYLFLCGWRYRLAPAASGK